MTRSLSIPSTTHKTLAYSYITKHIKTLRYPSSPDSSHQANHHAFINAATTRHRSLIDRLRLLDNNQFTGSIPSTLGLVQSLEVVRLDGNSLTGSLSTNISNLTEVTDMSLSNNQLTGLMPDLTGMNLLQNLDMSNNTFEASDLPSWITDLPTLTSLMMERTQLRGAIPASLFSLPQLQQVSFT